MIVLQRKTVIAGILVLLAGKCAAACLSPEYLAVSPDGKTLYATAATSGELLLFDIATQRLAGEWPLPVNPSGVAVAGDGTIYVTGGGVDGRLLKLDTNGKILAEVKTGHTPISPVVSKDGKTVYVLNRFDNNVTAVDTCKMEAKAAATVLREPHAAAVGAGGKLLFVANHLPACRATDQVVAAAVSVIDTSTFEVLSNVMLPNGSTGVRGIGASPDGQFIYVTHVLGRYQMPTTQLDRGWTISSALSVLEGKTGKHINTVLLDDSYLGAANPWGVTVSPDGKWLVVAHAGTKEISVIDREALHVRLDKAARNEKVTDVSISACQVPNDLAFLCGIRRRVKLDGDGPRGVAAVNGSVYTSLYFGDAMAKIDLATSPPKCSTTRLSANPASNAGRVRRGEMLWNDATMCFQQWASCASCHPDGRSDALNWDLLNDGMGNPKQSKNLVYSHLTPPTMVTGIRANMQICNRKGLTHILFAVRPEEDALCIDAYVSSLKPLPSPHLIKGELSPAALEGEKLFKKTGCATCHSPDNTGPGGERLFTDLKKHDIGLGVGLEEGRKFDTTTLVELWRTAPYLHDGRALSLEEVLTIHNANNTHGHTKHLTPEEIKVLAEYLRSL